MQRAIVDPTITVSDLHKALTKVLTGLLFTHTFLATKHVAVYPKGVTVLKLTNVMLILSFSV